MSETATATTSTSEGAPEAKAGRRARKPPSEWRKTPRYRAIKEMEPDFVSKAELAKHLCCHVQSIAEWVEGGTIPPPHSRPGVNHPIWLRSHYLAFVKSGRWPKEAWKFGGQSS